MGKGVSNFYVSPTSIFSVIYFFAHSKLEEEGVAIKLAAQGASNLIRYNGTKYYKSKNSKDTIKRSMPILLKWQSLIVCK